MKSILEGLAKLIGGIIIVYVMYLVFGWPNLDKFFQSKKSPQLMKMEERRKQLDKNVYELRQRQRTAPRKKQIEKNKYRIVLDSTSTDVVKDNRTKK